MKKNDILIILLSLLIGNIVGCAGNGKPVKEVIYIPVEENTISADSLRQVVKELELNRRRADSLDIAYDSINVLSRRCDSLSAEILVKNIKLERIRYYNDVAAKGNNIVFLRGWINRTLDNAEY